MTQALPFLNWTISAARFPEFMRIPLIGLAFGLALCFECSGLELVHLKNGFTLEADSHTEADGMTVLRMGTGTLTVGPSEIGSIEVLSQPAASAPQKQQEASPEPEKLLADAARAYGIDPAFVRSVAQIESGLRQGAISPKGAIGLMQLMPGTAADLQVNPREAASNASGGARYLRELLLRYQGDSVRALAAYNAGPGAVQKYKGAPPYEETRRYVTKVLEEYKRQLKAGNAAHTTSRKPGSAANKPSATD
jgi:hypothetical protein